MTNSVIQNTLQSYTQPFSPTLLRQTIRMLSLLATIHLLLMLIVLPNPLIPILLDTGLIVALVSGLTLLRLQRLRAARASIVIALWFYISITSLLLGGIQNPISGSYLVFVLMVGLFYSVRYALYAFIIPQLT